MQTALLVLTPSLFVILSIAAGYVFKDRGDRQAAQLDKLSDQFHELAIQVADRVGRVESRLDSLESQGESVRALLMQIALAVGAHPRPQTG